MIELLLSAHVEVASNCVVHVHRGWYWVQCSWKQIAHFAALVFLIELFYEIEKNRNRKNRAICAQLKNPVAMLPR